MFMLWDLEKIGALLSMSIQKRPWDLDNYELFLYRKGVGDMYESLYMLIRNLEKF